MPSNAIRRASHAGSWYSDSAKALSEELDRHLKRAKVVGGEMPLRALICPHAGYRYCAATAAWCWRQVVPSAVKRVFVLGPSHHVPLRGCALPSADIAVYETPLGNIPVDKKTLDDLWSKGGEAFQEMPLEKDENEHSQEMQLPFLKAVMKSADFSIVPVLVGEENKPKGFTHAFYANILLPYFQDPETLFIISSDFCHWGSRFVYQDVPRGMEDAPLYKAIEALDRRGIDLIVDQDANGFHKYLLETGNTICGRNPIQVLLSLIAKDGEQKNQTTFLHYSQSENITDKSKSSVSYAAIAVRGAPGK